MKAEQWTKLKQYKTYFSPFFKNRLYVLPGQKQPFYRLFSIYKNPTILITNITIRIQISLNPFKPQFP